MKNEEMKTKKQTLAVAIAIFSSLLTLPDCAYAQPKSTNSFSFQGALNGANGQPLANGPYDLRFKFYDSVTGGSQIGGTITNQNVIVTGGIASTPVQIDPTIISGQTLYLGIGINEGQELSPRILITAVPYSMRAANFNGAIIDSQLSSNIARLTGSQNFTGAVHFSNASNTFTGLFAGNGAGVTNVDFAANSAGAITPLPFYFNTVVLGVGNRPRSFTTADVNGDGRLDLICANFGDTTLGDGEGRSLTVLTNDGIGGFISALSIGVGRGPISVEGADVNGDGKIDLISLNEKDNTLSVLTNDGSGGFTLSSLLNVGTDPDALVAADVNGDGKTDLICANFSDNTLSVLTNNGTGGFSLSTVISVGPGPLSLVASDVNGDGKQDLLCANYSGGANGTITVLVNLGNGSFARSDYQVGNYPSSITAADVNADGKPDIIIANESLSGQLTVLTNDGSGGFVISSTIGVGANPISVTAADIDHDGKVDLISANYDDNTLTVLTNGGGGNFKFAALLRVGTNPFSVRVADLNGDGVPDVICANRGDNSLTLLGSAHGMNFQGNFTGNGAGLTLPDVPRYDVNGNLFTRGAMVAGHFEGTNQESSFLNWQGSGQTAAFYNVFGGPNYVYSGFGEAVGDNIASPVIWMYDNTGPNALQIRSRHYNDSVPNGTLLMSVSSLGDMILNGNARVKVLQITGGADLAEHLNVSDSHFTDEFSVRPGMVVSIDPTGNRKFKLSDQPYDRKRVGIISGGNGVKPGLVLSDQGNPQADGDQPIALTGQVWCHADANFGPINPGDLLTTSSTPGHAMRVSDDAKAHFAVLGQALTGLKEGRGWVQVLVGKQ